MIPAAAALENPDAKNPHQTAGGGARVFHDRSLEWAGMAMDARGKCPSIQERFNLWLGRIDGDFKMQCSWHATAVVK